MRATFIRTFEESRSEDLENIYALLEMAYTHAQFAEHRNEVDDAAKKREQRCDAFVAMANGAWNLRCVMHHCKHGCCGSWEDYGSSGN